MADDTVKYLSAGMKCDDCGLWPMPDPFNALLDENNNIVAYVCDECGKKYEKEDA